MKSATASVFAALGVLLACETETRIVPATELMLRINATPAVAERAHKLELLSATREGEGWKELQTLASPSTPVKFPVDVPWVPAKGIDFAIPRELIARVRDSNGAILTEMRRLTTFVHQQTRILDLILSLCQDGSDIPGCEHDEVCHGEGCKSCEQGRCEVVPFIAGDTLPRLLGPPLDGGMPDAEAGVDSTPDADEAGIGACDANSATCPDACISPPCGAACVDYDVYRCVGKDNRTPQICQGGMLHELPPCPNFCRDGIGCVEVPSCPSRDGCVAGSSCCESPVVVGGVFKRGYDGTPEYPNQNAVATVSTFRLDRFEVTVSRMRQWVERYPRVRPKVHDGKVRDPGDDGWVMTWDDLLPRDEADLRSDLKSCTASTWTDVPAQNEQLPINCVDWYVAFAFCAWDEGWLPTDAEWNYAATGGDEQRVYPWVEPGESATIREGQAVVATSAVQNVGSTMDIGRWGHADLAGNLVEWVRDAWSESYRPTRCVDCADLRDEPRVVRGGAYAFDRLAAKSNARDLQEPVMHNNEGGFRCAREK